jgi:hypothetical protein
MRNVVHVAVLGSLVAFLLFVFLCSIGNSDTLTFNNGADYGDSIVSPLDRSTSPTTGRNFLGLFGNETVTLTVPVPVEKRYINWVYTKIELIRVGDWETAAWSYGIPGEEALYTFSPDDVGPDWLWSEHPQPWPLLEYQKPARLTETNTLGYGNDEVLQLRHQFEYDKPIISLEFRGKGFAAEDSWGIDNVTIAGRAIPEPSAISLVVVVGLLSALALLRQRNLKSRNHKKPIKQHLTQGD